MVEGAYHYSFSVDHPQEYSNRRERVRAFFREAHGLIDILKQDAQSLPIITPFPDREIQLVFEHPLSDFMLEKVASAGYRCLSPQQYISDRAAE